FVGVLVPWSVDHEDPECDSWYAVESVKHPRITVRRPLGCGVRGAGNLRRFRGCRLLHRAREHDRTPNLPCRLQDVDCAQQVALDHRQDQSTLSGSCHVTGQMEEHIRTDCSDDGPWNVLIRQVSMPPLRPVAIHGSQLTGNRMHLGASAMQTRTQPRSNKPRRSGQKDPPTGQCYSVVPHQGISRSKSCSTSVRTAWSRTANDKRDCSATSSSDREPSERLSTQRRASSNWPASDSPPSA